MDQYPKYPILFFDGYCNLCNFFVSLVLKYEKKTEIKFASLQGEQAKTLLSSYITRNELLESVVFLKDGKIFTKTNAILELSKFLKAPLSWLYLLRVLPRWLTDTVYDLIARKRYAIFGQSKTCRIPTLEELPRFLA